MKWVLISARNAGVFVKYDQRKDRVAIVGRNGKSPESLLREPSHMREPPVGTLHATTVANMLSVLCGLRPVPTTRLKGYSKKQMADPKNGARIVGIDKYVGNALKTHEAIVRMAKEARIVVKTMQQYETRTGKKDVCEIKVVHPWFESLIPPDRNKLVDLTGKNIDFLTYTWLTWDRYLAKIAGGRQGIENIPAFAEALSLLSGIPKGKLRSIPLPDVLRIAHSRHNSLPKSELKATLALLSGGNEGIAKLVTDGKIGDLSWIRDAKGQELLNVKRAAKVRYDDFEIYIPHSAELQRMLGRGCGFANLLEGGLARYEKTTLNSPPPNAVAPAGDI